MEEMVFLNGKFSPIREAKVSVSIPGLLYGWGLFETMRSYHNKIVYFDEHLRRIKNSCKLIDMKFPYSLDRLKKIIKETVKINGYIDVYIRLSLWKSNKGTDILINVRRYRPYSSGDYRNGFHACISRFRQDENSLLARIKTTNRLLYHLSLQEAKNKGFDEAIILNNRGYLAEGSHSNIFLVKDGEMFTPSLECGCLDGITRKVIFGLAQKNNIKLYEGNLTLQNLYDADEVFLTNSLMGVMPLASLKRKNVRKAKCGKLTKFFTEKYNSLLK